MSDDSNSRLTASAKRYEARAIAALVLGIAAVVLIYPFGVVLGPLALWFGISALRRINRSGRSLAGSGIAIAGVVTGAIVCVIYASVLFVELVAIVLFGGLIPAY